MSSDLVARCRSQQGTTLLLMPVAVLVLFILAAVAVDAAVLFLGQRRLADLASALARDAVAAVEEASFYDDDALGLDLGEVRNREARLTSSLPRDDALLDPTCGVETTHTAGDPVAVVTCSARVRLVFTATVPGAERIREVTANETAVGRQR